MMLRNSREGFGGQAPENAFEMIDERSGAVLGSCVATPEERSGLFPERPYHVRLDLSGDESVLYKLLGAALARARALCRRWTARPHLRPLRPGGSENPGHSQRMRIPG